MKNKIKKSLIEGRKLVIEMRGKEKEGTDGSNLCDEVGSTNSVSFSLFFCLLILAANFFNLHLFFPNLILISSSDFAGVFRIYLSFPTFNFPLIIPNPNRVCSFFFFFQRLFHFTNPFISLISPSVLFCSVFCDHIVACKYL